MTRFILTTFTFLLLWVGCAADPDRPEPEPEPIAKLARIELAAEATTLDPGASMQLVARAFAIDGTPMAVPAIAWTSSDDGIVAVDSGGRVTASTVAGSARITARNGQIAGTIDLSVREVIAVVDEVRIWPAGEIVLGRGATQQLTATAYDVHGEVLPGRAITWTSENGALASISDTGVLSAIAAGTTTIRAHCEGVFADAAIRVTIPVARVALDVGPTMALQPGNTRQLTATAFADDNTQLENRAITWASTDTSVATVTDGLVTAIAAGTTRVTASVEGVSAQLDLTVRAVGRIQLNYEEATLDIEEQLQLVASVYDTNGQPMDAYVTWSSDHPEHATVESNGMLTGRTEGGAIVTATSGGVSATVTVFVTRWTEHMLATVNGAALPATLYEYTANIGGVDRQLRMQAADGVLAIRWLDGRYEMMVFGPVFIDGVETGYHSHSSVGSVVWDSAASVFRFTPDDFANAFTGLYEGTSMKLQWQPDPRAAPATLVFAPN